MPGQSVCHYRTLLLFLQLMYESFPVYIGNENDDPAEDNDNAEPLVLPGLGKTPHDGEGYGAKKTACSRDDDEC